MADLLRKGYTMLNQACPNCNNPIFRSRSGDMFCPSCNKPVVFSEKIVDVLKNKKSKIEKDFVPSEDVHNFDTFTFLYSVISNKLNLIADHLSKETELSNFNGYLRTIHRILKILHQLKELDIN